MGGQAMAAGQRPRIPRACKVQPAARAQPGGCERVVTTELRRRFHGYSMDLRWIPGVVALSLQSLLQPAPAALGAGTGRQTALGSNMFITGLGTAVPPQCYAQQAGWEAFAQSTLFHRLQPRARAIIRKALNGRR